MPVRVFLILMLAADAAFVVLSVVHFTSPYLPGTLYSIEAEGGYAEWFQYTKELWAILLLITLWKKTRRPWVVGWLMLFTYFLLDDAMSIHETGGDIAYRHLGFGPALGLRAVDFGEILVTGIAGIFLFTIIAVLYRRSTEEERTVSRDLQLLATVLVTFGVALDLVHSLIRAETLRIIVGTIEDGGEMVTMSVTCWYLLAVTNRGGAAPVPPLVERVRAAVRL
jgi:hypothetical protein